MKARVYILYAGLDFFLNPYFQNPYWTDPKNLGGTIDLLSSVRPSVRPSGWIPLERLHSFF